MARRHRPNLQYVWRSVITNRWPTNGMTKIEYAGPFTAEGYARNAVAHYHGAITEIVVQRSKLIWEDVSREEFS
jgi:hypothetical protein